MRCVRHLVLIALGADIRRPEVNPQPENQGADLNGTVVGPQQRGLTPSPSRT